MFGPIPCEAACHKSLDSGYLTRRDLAPIVRPPCNLAGRQAQVCRGRAGHPTRAGRAAWPQSRTSEAPPDGRALGKGPGAAAGALLFSAGKKLVLFARDGARVT